jgi:AmiR/NasT family two-component response regulator
MVRIHNTETDEVIDREMNDDEFAQYELDIAESENRVKAEKATADAKAALLTKLGITAEEAVLLLS